jgi:serine-type D-Ala-D-Ala carboxypeptidase (penicillin-binding protein 5/6)
MKKFSFLKNVSPKFYLFSFPFFFAYIFILLLIINFLVSFWVIQNKLLTLPFEVKVPAKLPIIKTSFIPQISAKGAIIMDAKSKVVLYAKNPDLRFSTASTAKIMTGLVAVEHFKSIDILTVKQASDEGSNIGLKKGQQFTFENLLYAMLLPSANDAALAISQNYPGGETAFITKMNKLAGNLQLFNTHYIDAAGLEDSGDYTTPFDLARLASFAVSNSSFQKVVSTKQINISDLQGNTYNLENLNKLLGENGVNGVKTGFTEEAGQVLVTSKLEKGKTIIIVVMGSEDRFADTEKLIDLVSNNLTYLSIHP